MTPTKGPRILLIGVLGLLLSAGALSVRADAFHQTKLRLNANAVDLSGVGRPQTKSLEIVIDRWSSDAERDQLLGILEDGGSERLLPALQAVKPRAGFIRTTTGLGWDIQFAREHPLPDGGRRIVFATDRPMSFFELRDQPRSADYEYMLCEIRLGPNGIGEGKLATLAKISYDKEKNSVEVENYGIEPVRLTRVSVEK
jgi:hypothetical protein